MSDKTCGTCAYGNRLVVCDLSGKHHRKAHMCDAMLPVNEPPMIEAVPGGYMSHINIKIGYTQRTDSVEQLARDLFEEIRFYDIADEYEERFNALGVDV